MKYRFGFMLGPVLVAVESDQELVCRYFAERFRGFERGDTTPEAWVNLRLMAEGEGARSKLSTAGETLKIDLAACGPDWPTLANQGLQLAVARVLAGMRAVLVHAALVGFDGKGVILAGPSGSGKSTLAGIIGEHAVCDELCVVGERHGRWLAWSTALNRGKPAVLEAGAVVLLKRSDFLSLVDVEFKIGARMLLEQVILPLDREAGARAAATVLGLVSSLPGRVLNHGPCKPSRSELNHILKELARRAA